MFHNERCRSLFPRTFTYLLPHAFYDSLILIRFATNVFV
jgi:hypothetical protein